MKEISIPLEYFDIEAFLNETIDYLRTQVSPGIHPTYGIVWVDRPGDVPGYGREMPDGRQLDAARKQEDEKLPFPFATRNDLQPGSAS